MKSLFNCMSAACIIAAGGAFAEEVNGKWGGQSFYGFAEYGVAKSDINVSSASVTSGSYTYTEALDSSGTIAKLGVGFAIAEKTSFELYSGRLKGFSNTATITATNAVVSGQTWNGSLVAKEEVSADLLGINVVMSDKHLFEDGSEVSYFGRAGVVRFDLKDVISLSGGGTVDGAAVNVSAAIATLKQTGTTMSLGGGVAYSLGNGMVVNGALDYIPNVGGGFLSKSNVTTLTVGLSKSF
jgi:hypothetical protein